MKTKEDTKQITNRKLEHINIVLNQDVEPLPSVWQKYNLPYQALPEIDLKDVKTEVQFFGKTLSFPFVISSMTGGEQKGMTINRNLALAAEEVKVALGLGSMRITLRQTDSFKSFDVRKLCPSIPLFANLGLVQLNYGIGIDQINQIIDSIEADGIFLHVNALQEAVQPEGDTNFAGLIAKLEQILPKLHAPVIVKEVGNGIDFATAKELAEIGVQWIDVAGLGGTSWPQVEGYRRDDDLGEIVKTIGIPTDQALIKNSKIKGLKLIAGGGIRNGIDIAKAIALGAHMATAAKPLLPAALQSPDEVIKILESWKNQLQIAMFVTGSKTLTDLHKLKLTQ